MVNYALQLDDVFGALANAQRREILRFLSDGPRSISELAEPLRLSLPAIHKHLKILQRAGLIGRTKIGRSNTINLEAAAMADAKQWIDSYEKFWTGHLDSLELYINQMDRD